MLYCRYVMVSGCHYVTDAMMSLCNGWLSLCIRCCGSFM